MTVEEIKAAFEELNDIWDNGNQNSLPFCRYMKQALEELTSDCAYKLDEDLPEWLDDAINFLEDDVWQHWRLCKIDAGETRGMLQIPIGE